MSLDVTGTGGRGPSTPEGTWKVSAGPITVVDVTGVRGVDRRGLSRRIRSVLVKTLPTSRERGRRALT